MADSPLVNDRIITTMCTPTNGRRVDLIALHTLEYPERVGAARWAADYFRTVQASANYCVDAQEIIGNVWEKDMPWTTPGVNERSISIEQAGYAGQSVSEWADTYSRSMLENTAKLTADICKRNNIPPVLLSNAQLAAGHKGIIHHVQASEVYRMSDHWDCGPNFPWSYFMGRVAQYYGGGTGGIVPTAPTQPQKDWFDMADQKMLEVALNNVFQKSKGLIRECVHDVLHLEEVKREGSVNGKPVGGTTTVITEIKYLAKNFGDVLAAVAGVKKDVIFTQGQVAKLPEAVAAALAAGGAVTVEGQPVDRATVAAAVREVLNSTELTVKEG